MDLGRALICPYDIIDIKSGPVGNKICYISKGFDFEKYISEKKEEIKNFMATRIPIIQDSSDSGMDISVDSPVGLPDTEAPPIRRI